jgi:non-heme chloroperoxidase
VLEVIHVHARRPVGAPPLLFVHGAYIGAWCWAQYFLPYFADHGFDCYALSLRGHGESEGIETLQLHGIDDYVADVFAVAQGLPATPIVIGHSMGGAVAQRFASRYPIAGLALLASVSPQGLLPSSIGLMLRDPLLSMDLAMVLAGLGRHADFDRLRRALFAVDMPASRAAGYFAKMQSESSRALAELSCLHLDPRRRRLSVPLVVIGAEYDGLFFEETIEASARWYGIKPTTAARVGHTMMLDVNWQQAARVLLEWTVANFADKKRTRIANGRPRRD